MYLRTYLPTYLLTTHVPPYLCTSVPPYLRTCLPTYIPYLRTCVPAYLRTYVHTYLRSYAPSSLPTCMHADGRGCAATHAQKRRGARRRGLLAVPRPTSSTPSPSARPRRGPARPGLPRRVSSAPAQAETSQIEVVFAKATPSLSGLSTAACGDRQHLV